MPLGSQFPRVEVGAPISIGQRAGAEVAALVKQSGVTLDPWQERVLDIGLAQGHDGAFLALETCVVVPRQNGKSVLLAALALAAVTIFDANLVIYSAHEFKTALETHHLVSRMVQDNPSLRRRWLKDRRSNAETGIEFKDGSRIRFLARSRSSGRGFSADLVVLDEAFALQSSQLGALLPTLSARPNPQVWMASSAAMHDSEALHQVRGRALGSTPGRLAYMEWSVEPGTSLDDREGWAQANPALGYRLSERWIETELASMPAREFERERLGVPDDADGASAFDAARWTTLIDGDSSVPQALGFGFDVTPERDQAAIAVAGVRIQDARAHVEVVEYLPGTEWCIARLVDLYKRREAPVWIELGSPAAAFVDPLRARGVDVRTIGKYGGHDPLFADAITNGTLRHLGQASITGALLGSRQSVSGDTWSYSRASSTVDICPLKAGSLAHYGAMVEPATVRVGMY